jgi:hypothetical protein
MYRKSATRPSLIRLASRSGFRTRVDQDLRHYLQAIDSYQACFAAPSLSFQRHLQNVISAGRRRSHSSERKLPV